MPLDNTFLRFLSGFVGWRVLGAGLVAESRGEGLAGWMLRIEGSWLPDSSLPRDIVVGDSKSLEDRHTV